jgi:hypothetical protein
MPRKIKSISSAEPSWSLSVVEHWCLYTRMTGFQPTGAHRQLLDKLFFPYWYTCEICNGIGIVDGPDEDTWKNCSICFSNGGFFTGTTDEWEKLIYKVMDKYPECVCGNTKERYWDIFKHYTDN